jgi:hypothetical protein
MRKIITKKSLMPKLGDEAYKVEWCCELPLEADGKTAIIDAAKYYRRLFPSLKLAEVFARKILPKDKFGSVLIYPVRFTDPHYDSEFAGIRSEFCWEATGDAIEVS